jgi:polar amino acid transport system ATP-binding protein
VGEVLGVIRDLAFGGMTMIIVTHEISFTREVADLVAIMDEGRVVESGAPGQVLVDPATAHARAFLQRLL